MNLFRSKGSRSRFCFSFPVFPDAQGGEETKVAVQRNLADIINEAPPESSTPAPEAMPSSSLPSTPVATPTPPIQNKSTTKVKPIGVDMDTSGMNFCI